MMRRTGPIKPQGRSSSSPVRCFHVVKQTRRGSGLERFLRTRSGHSRKAPIPSSGIRSSNEQSGGKCSSPIKRFAQRFTTRTSRRFSPSWAHSLISTLYGCFQSNPKCARRPRRASRHHLPTPSAGRQAGQFEKILSHAATIFPPQHRAKKRRIPGNGFQEYVVYWSL